LAKSINELRFS